MFGLTQKEREKVFLGVAILVSFLVFFSWSSTVLAWSNPRFVELNPVNRVLMSVWLPLPLFTISFLSLLFAYFVWKRNEYLGFLMLGIILGIAGLDAMVWIWAWWI